MSTPEPKTALPWQIEYGRSSTIAPADAGLLALIPGMILGSSTKDWRDGQLVVPISPTNITLVGDLRPGPADSDPLPLATVNNLFRGALSEMWTVQNPAGSYGLG